MTAGGSCNASTAAEPADYGATLAHQLARWPFVERRKPGHLVGNGRPMLRALTMSEAMDYALGRISDDGQMLSHSEIMRGLWSQLASYDTPELALSLQRLITAMVTVAAWRDGINGQAQVMARAEQARAMTKAQMEADELARWPRRESVAAGKPA